MKFLNSDILFSFNHRQCNYYKMKNEIKKIIEKIDIKIVIQLNFRFSMNAT